VTRLMFVLSAVFFVVMVFSFVGGIASMSAGALLLAMFVAGPLFTFCLAFGLGRASNEFTIVRRAQVQNGRVSRVARPEREVLG